MAKTLSIVVTIVGGGRYLDDFLQSLKHFRNPPELDVIIPYDASLPRMAETIEKYPEYRFMDLGAISTGRPITSEAGKHELYDRRRAAGLAAARGDVIAILEDHGHPHPDWAQNAMRLHEERKNAVIGGVIECQDGATLLNWSLWVTDLGRYGRPVENEEVEWVSDVNITYKRRAVEATRHLWQDRYHEPVVHWHLMEQGETLLLSDNLIVTHRRPMVSLARLVHERFDWGRLFGYMRGSKLPLHKRLAYVVGAPAIPPILWLRHGRVQGRKGNIFKYLKALPYVIVLTTVWTAGEAWGTLTRRP